MGIVNNLKVLRARWWIIVLVAVFGTLVGIFLAMNHNRSIRTTWRAEAPVTFISFSEDDGSSGSQSKGSQSTSSSVDAQAEGVRAQLLLEETLRANPRLAVVVDRSNNILLFTAIGRDGDTTLAQALELRSQYQDVSSEALNIDQVREAIGTLIVDIEVLQARIKEAEAEEPPEEDPSITSSRTVLVAQIDTLNQRQTELGIWVLNPELRPTEDEFFGIVPEQVKNSDTTETTLPPEPVYISTEELNKEIEENTKVLERLGVQLTLIPAAPVIEELDTQAMLALEAMQAEATELQEQYVELLQIADGRSPGGFFEEPTATDETQAVKPVALYGFAGFLAGALLASVLLIGADKARKTLWAPSSLEDIVSLGVIDRNRSDGLPKDVWYPTSSSRRRREIQTFRATIDAITQEQPAIVGFFGVSTAGAEVGELAADLATAYTVAGRDVLLIDANSYEPNTLTEYGDKASSLTQILVRSLPVSEAATAIGDLIDSTPQVVPHLTSLHVDATTHDPVDAIASPNARSLMDIARERFDIVIVAAPAISDTLSDTVARRIDFAVLTGQIGKTTMPQVAAATAVLTDRRTMSPGVVLLYGKRRALFAKLKGMTRSVRAKVSRGDSKESRTHSDRQSPQPTAGRADAEELEAPKAKAESS